MSRRVSGPALTIHRHRSVRGDVRGDNVSGRSLVGVPDLATVVAVGPFDDLEHAQQLAAMFTDVQPTCRTQLVLLGRGARRSLVVRRAAERALQVRLVLIDDCAGPQWSDLVAGADLVIPSPDSAPRALVEVMAAGRAVVASASPATAQLVLPHSAGLLYAPGEASAMTAAVARLLAHPELRREMGRRASQVAQRQHPQPLGRPWPDDQKKYA
jgi:glycosyltransferase involved in cell wall biosynthesis